MHSQTTWLPPTGDGVFSLLRRAAQLGGLQSRQAVAELLEMMDHSSPLVRSEAARELAHIGRALRQKGRLMLQIGQPRSGILTAQGLIDELMAQAGQRSERWREAWAESLGQWRHEGAVPALAVLIADASPLVRASAAQALGETRDLDAVAPLRRAAVDDDAQVRRNVAAAVGTIGLSEGLDALEPLWADSQLLVRCAALQALGNLPGARALNWLHAALEDPSPELRWQAARSLARVGRIASLPHLERLFTNTTPICGGTIGEAAQQAAVHIREREGSLWSQIWRALLWLGRRVRRMVRGMARHRS